MHTHDFANWPFEQKVNTMCFCTAKVANGLFPVLQVTRDWDGDWQFLDLTTIEPEDCTLLCFGCVYEQDRTLSEIADLKLGWSAWRDSVGAMWHREENPCDDEP